MNPKEYFATRFKDLPNLKISKLDPATAVVFCGMFIWIFSKVRLNRRNSSPVILSISDWLLDLEKGTTANPLPQFWVSGISGDSLFSGFKSISVYIGVYIDMLSRMVWIALRDHPYKKSANFSRFLTPTPLPSAVFYYYPSANLANFWPLPP